MANPIKTVDGVSVKCPSEFQWMLQDISDSDAGRTEDTVMHKNRIGQCVKIELKWNGLRLSEIQPILEAFNPEYIDVCYLDPLEGGYVTSEFYVGDRTAPLYNSALDVWENVSFNIVERSGT